MSWRNRCVKALGAKAGSGSPGFARQTPRASSNHRGRRVILGGIPNTSGHTHRPSTWPACSRHRCGRRGVHHRRGLRRDLLLLHVRRRQDPAVRVPRPRRRLLRRRRRLLMRHRHLLRLRRQVRPRGWRRRLHCRLTRSRRLHLRLHRHGGVGSRCELLVTSYQMRAASACCPRRCEEA